MTSNNKEPGQTNDVWLLQDKLLTNDPKLQKEAVQELLKINSKESIFILRRYLASKLYSGAPVDVITDIVGSHIFAMDEVREFRFGDFSFQLFVNQENKIINTVGLDLISLPNVSTTFEKVTIEDIHPSYKDIVDAAGKGDIEGVKQFIKQGADVNMCGSSGATALYNAVERNHLETVIALIEAGASIEKGYDDRTPLIEAADKGNLQIVKYLLDNGADIDAKNDNGHTAFMLAAQGNDDRYVPVVKLLVEKGAQIHLKNQWGQTAFQQVRNSQVKQYLNPLFLSSRQDALPALAEVKKQGDEKEEAEKRLPSFGQNTKTIAISAEEQQKVPSSEFDQKDAKNISAPKAISAKENKYRNIVVFTVAMSIIGIIIVGSVVYKLILKPLSMLSASSHLVSSPSPTSVPILALPPTITAVVTDIFPSPTSVPALALSPTIAAVATDIFPSPTPAPIILPANIAFVSGRDGKSEIYVMYADGSNQTRLTNNESANFSPTWSPDGKYIAFVSDRDGNPEIYIMNSDGSNQTRLTNNENTDSDPAWSPNGIYIAFVSDRDGNDKIYTMKVDGSNQLRLTNDERADIDPAWSPDGKYIAFLAYPDGSPNIYIMNADGSNQKRLSNIKAEVKSPAWSPDSKEIMFSSWDNNIYVINADGSKQTIILKKKLSYFPAWSPDGKRIAFGCNGGHLCSMMSDGSSLITYNDIYLDGPPSWSPDNKYIAFKANDGSIGMINVENLEQARLTDNLSIEPVWSPVCAACP